MHKSELRMLMVRYVYTREPNQNPSSKTLELHQAQHYCSVAHVIAQQYSSTTFVS